jgi:predicted nucleic acid-binding protein
VIVVDCSYTMALVMPDAHRPPSMQRALAARLFVPSIWPFEVANALRNMVRRRRLSDAEVGNICSQIEAVEIDVVASGDVGVRQRYLAAQAHELTAYDAAYLELAVQRRCALATLDSHLAAVAQSAGVQVLD